MDRVPLRRHEPDRPDDIKGDENTEINDTKGLEDPEGTELLRVCARLFQIFPVPDNEGCRIYRGLVRVAKQDARGWTCLLQLPLVPENVHRDCTCLFQLFLVPDNDGSEAQHEIPGVAEHQGHEVCSTHWPDENDG